MTARKPNIPSDCLEPKSGIPVWLQLAGVLVLTFVGVARDQLRRLATEL